MKNLSAPRLLRLALAGNHMPYCPHVGDSTSGTECPCWKHEVRKWDVRMKLTSSKRTRLPRAQKVHLTGYKCSAKAATTFASASSITCKQCLRHANKPIKVKPVKIAGRKSKIVGVPAKKMKPLYNSSQIFTPTSHVTITP